MSNFKRYFLVLPIICILLVPCTSFFVSAADFNFIFNIPEPIVDNWTGYVIQPRSNYSYSNKSVDLYFWVVAPLGDYSLSFPTVDYEYTSNAVYLNFSSTASDESYFVTLYKTSSYDNGTGSVIVLDSFSVTASNARTITISKGSYDVFWRPVFKNVSCPSDSFPSSGASYTVIWSDDVAIYNELIESNTKLTNLINSLDLTNEQLEEISSLLSDISGDTAVLVALVDQFWNEWYQWSWTEDEYYNRIIDLLEDLIEGTADYEEPTISPEQDEMNNIEDELLNNESASDAQEDIKIEINENAMSYIWDLVTSFINTNPKIFGLFISILSLGIIALILNR